MRIAMLELFAIVLLGGIKAASFCRTRIIDSVVALLRKSILCPVFSININGEFPETYQFNIAFYIFDKFYYAKI